MVLAVVALLAPLWLPVCLVIVLAIWLEDRGRIFYLQERLGQGGRLFNIVKFRTMVQNAEHLTGPVLAFRSDVRSTRVGRMLRRSHLDEVPQLFNVLRGEMSFVGPRPERPELYQQIEQELPAFARRLRVKPGIAGLAQARGGYHAAPRVKLRYDNLYVKTMGPWLDLKLLLRCLWIALSPGSAGKRFSMSSAGAARSAKARGKACPEQETLREAAPQAVHGGGRQERRPGAGVSATQGGRGVAR